MPEPITIVAGVTTIVGNVWRISKDVYELIDGVGNAPKHIFALAQDVRGLYGVLGSLQIPIFEGLQQPLDHCFWAFRELQMKICKYIKPTGDPRQSKWAAFRWQFTEKDTNVYRSHLASYKLTVDVALATANLANTSQNIQATASLEFQIQAMRIQLEGFEQNNADGPCGSVDVDNGSQTTDRQFALRRFLESAETAFSGSPPVSPTLSARRDKSFSPPRRQSVPLEVELDAAAGRYSQSELKLDSAYSTRQYTEELSREASPPKMKTNAMAEGLSNVPPTVAPEHPAMHHHPSSLLAEKKKSPTRFNETGRPIIFSARALYAYHAVIPEELSFEKGDTLTILRLQDDGWWEAEVEGKNSKPALAPSNYLSRLEDLPESLSTPLTGTPGTTKSENVRRPTNYRPFVEDGSELPTRRRSRSRDNAGKGSGNVAGPPVSVKVKVHGGGDRTITLRRLTKQEAAAEKKARRLERIAWNDNTQAKQEVSAVKDGAVKWSGNAADLPVSVKVKVHKDKDQTVTLRRLTEQEATAKREARRLEYIAQNNNT